MRFADLFDITSLQNLLDAFYEATGIPSGIVDVDSTVLTATGWQDICANFHRSHPAAAKICRKSDRKIARYAAEETPIGYKCGNGLYDYANPIIVGGKLLATLFIGQFFTEEPDEMFFLEQARKYGFDVEAYLAALRKVPIIPPERVKKIVNFYTQLAHTLSTMGNQALQLIKNANFKETLLESIPNPVYYKDRNGVYLGCNKAFEEFIGLSKQQIIGKTVHDVFPSEWANKYSQMDSNFFDRPQPQTCEYAVDMRGGEHHVILNKASFTDVDGSIDLVGVILDITERKQMEAKLQESEDNYRALFSHMIDGFMFLQVLHNAERMPEFLILDVNQKYEEIIGTTRDKVVNRKISEVVPTAPRWAAILREVASTGKSTYFEYYSKHLLKWLLLSAYSPKKGYIAVVVSDITAKKRNEEQIQQFAFHDHLTGLPNRRLLEDRLTVAVAQAKRENEIVAVVFLDLDNFKPVNDRYGHEAGDKLLQQLANRLLASVREADTVARSGGDEFVLVLPRLRNRCEAEQIVLRILGDCREPFVIRGNSVVVSASIGVSLFPNDGSDIAELIRRADIAMYHSKKKGRDQICFVDDCI